MSKFVWLYVKCALVLVLFGVIYGFLIPMTVSSKDSMMAVIGLLGGLIVAPAILMIAIHNVVNSFINLKKENSK